MVKPLYVVDPNYVRPNLSKALFAAMKDLDQLKRDAEARMKAYDALPKLARRAVNEYGQLRAAVHCNSHKASDKCNAVRNAYEIKLEKSAVCI